MHDYSIESEWAPSASERTTGNFLNYLSIYDTGRDTSTQPNNDSLNQENSGSPADVPSGFGAVEIQEKRGPIPQVRPIEVEGLRFTPGSTGLSGYLDVSDTDTNKLLCRVPVFNYMHIKGLEDDVQDTFISDMFMRRDRIFTIDERGGVASFRLSDIKKACGR